MSKFTRLGYLIGAAAIHFVIMLNAGPAFAACKAGDQLMGDGRCFRDGRPTGQVDCDGECQAAPQQHRDVAICIDRCTARANNGTPIPHIVDDDGEDNGPSIFDPWVAQCAVNCRSGRRQPW
jgi:hypothetical protein